MEDVFELQDEIARKIAEALRVTLSPQEEAALASKPTENLQAYDLYLRGKSYARRLTRQDNEFALQMFENAVALDPDFALAHAAIANVCAQMHYSYGRDPVWLERARAASRKAVALQARTPRARRRARLEPLRRRRGTTTPSRRVRQAIERKSDCEGAYYLLGRTLFAAGRYQELRGRGREGHGGGRAGLQHLRPDPERARRARQDRGAEERPPALASRRSRTTSGRCRRTRAPGSSSRATTPSSGRGEDAIREANLAVALRPNEATVLYNAACVFCALKDKAQALDAMKKAWNAGFRDSDWSRRDPDLSLIHGDPEFERLYPEPPARA